MPGGYAVWHEFEVISDNGTMEHKDWWFENHNPVKIDYLDKIILTIELWDFPSYVVFNGPDPSTAYITITKPNYLDSGDVALVDMETYLLVKYRPRTATAQKI